MGISLDCRDKRAYRTVLFYLTDLPLSSTFSTSAFSNDSSLSNLVTVDSEIGTKAKGCLGVSGAAKEIP